MIAVVSDERPALVCKIIRSYIGEVISLKICLLYLVESKNVKADLTAHVSFKVEPILYQ